MHARAAALPSGDFDGWPYGLGTSNIYDWQLQGLHARMVNDILFAGVIYKSRPTPMTISCA
jgi:hypothetical protein